MPASTSSRSTGRASATRRCCRRSATASRRWLSWRTGSSRRSTWSRSSSWATRGAAPSPSATRRRTRRSCARSCCSTAGTSTTATCPTSTPTGRRRSGSPRPRRGTRGCAEARGKAMHGMTDRVSVAWPVLAEHEIPTLLLLATVDPHGDPEPRARRRLRAGAAAGGGALGRGRGPRAARRRGAAARRRDRGLAAQPGRVGGPPDRCQAPVRELCQERDESSTDGVGALDARHASGCGCVRADGLVPWMRRPSDQARPADAVAGDGAGCPPRQGSPLPAKPPRLHCRPCP